MYFLSVGIIIYQPFNKHLRHACNTEGIEAADVWDKRGPNFPWAVPYMIHVESSALADNGMKTQYITQSLVFNAKVRERQKVKHHSRDVTP